MGARRNNSVPVSAEVALEATVIALSHVGHGKRPPIALIDGRSGAGKTSLASAARERYPRASIIRLDDIYPGWNGLEAARRQLIEGVLEPRAEGRPARWRRWNWSADAASEWVTVEASTPLIIEGVGALSRVSRELANIAVWIDLDDHARKTRALARDGEAFASHWEQWAKSEGEFITRERPRDHADVVVDGRTIVG